MWSLSLIIGSIATAITVSLLAVAARFLYRMWIDESRRYPNSADTSTIWAARICVGTAVIIVLMFLGATFPWEKTYHYYETFSGTVAEIEARLLADGSGMSEKYAVRYEGNPQEYGCEDTRCALVKPGDVLTLRCIKVWEYTGTDGYDCSYVGVE